MSPVTFCETFGHDFIPYFDDEDRTWYSICKKCGYKEIDE